MRRLVFACIVICLLTAVSGCCDNKHFVSGTIANQSAGVDQDVTAASDGIATQEGLLTDISDSDVVSSHLWDFSDGFSRQWDTTSESYPIQNGNAYENTIIALKGENEGASIYVVAGLHGDETAGFIAGNLLKELTLRSGVLYILSPANQYGALHGQRETKSGFDPNRHFPGKEDGTDAEAMDAAIFADIKEKAPDLVLDLHEAEAAQNGSDSLGNSIICDDVSLSGDLVWEILLASENGTLGGETLSLYAGAPKGSLNYTVTRELGIPVITIETKSEEQLVQRVGMHLRIVEFILNQYGMR